MCVFKYALLLKHNIANTHYYRPQTKFAKVMFSQVSVCPQEGCLPLVPGGVYHNCPTWADNPLGRQPQGRQPPIWTPPGRHTPMQPRHTPFPVHAGIHTPLCQCMLGYSQQAGSTHPTGMHSC